MEQLRRQLAYSKRQTAFAWAKYYEQVNYQHNMNLTMYNSHNNMVNGAEELPTHLVSEIEKMISELKKEIECPICMDIIGEGKLKITGCGHKYCDECFDKIDECAICRRKINKK